MINACKKASWLNIVSIIVIVVGAVFGILSAVEFGKYTDGTSFLKWVLLVFSIALVIMLTISCVVSFKTMRDGNVKSSILALGKNAKFQATAPFASLVMALIGLISAYVEAYNNGLDTDGYSGLIVFVIVAYIVTIFTFGFNSNSIKAFRKDKETYDYTAITSFICAASLIVFCVAAVIGMTKIPPVENNHAIGFLEAFIILYSAADLLAYVTLGVAAIIGKKYAPKLSMADADAAKLDDLAKSINQINENLTKSNGGATPARPAAAPTQAPTKAAPMDNVAKLREYKKLMDEGVITKEEFEKKKKELL